jgi:hypothetical protein
MAGIGRAIYGPGAGAEAAPWEMLARAVRAVSTRQSGPAPRALPALNPGHAG